MTDLFTEALKDAQKLRDIAEKDAKNRLVEALTPYIKKVIAEQSSGDTHDFYFEQAEDDELDLEAQPQQPPAAPPAAPQGAVAPQPAVDATAEPVAADATIPTADPAPIEDPAALGDVGVDATMPDEEGKITVDFEDLFVDADSDQVTITPPVSGEVPAEAPVAAVGEEQPLAPAPAPEAVPGEEEALDLPTEGVTFKEYQRVLSDVSERVDRALYSNHVSDITRESLKQRLFDLLEAIDGMRGRGIISNKQARLNENKLEFLFLKLKEASLHNSYSVSNEDKGTDMKTLKEYAAQLFEEDENLAKDSVSTGESGMAVDDEYSEHAADVSGVDPHLGGPEDVEVAQDRHIQEADALPASDNPDEEPWDEAEPVIDEEDQDKTVTHSMNENSADANTDANEDVAEGAAGFGDTNEEPAAEFEVDDAELAEAVRAIRKESIKKKLAALREAEGAEHSSDLGQEASEDYPVPEKEMKDEPSQENLKEQALMELDDMDDEIEVVDDMAPEGDMGDDADLVLSVDLPPEVEEELAELGLDELDVDVDLNVDMDLDDAGVEDDLGGDLGDAGEAESAEEDVVLQDDMDEMVHMENKKLAKKAALLEKKLAQAKRVLNAKNKEVSDLKGQLAETNLFTSKAVLYSKFLHRALTEKALTKKALQQIVEHLDKGKTVAETKAIYKKIEHKLNEHAKASRKLGGSSSKVTRPGSANLNESANSHASDPETQTASRWQVLAGIKKGE